ncbi:unnamed protein product [Calicophoron daubneyi]|uniref:Uncharacterized protein n=1 Tax=Calicophoron daubneyi TaxID=300641 RepID=A0AAV2T446_CALDB
MTARLILSPGTGSRCIDFPFKQRVLIQTNVLSGALKLPGTIAGMSESLVCPLTILTLMSLSWFVLDVRTHTILTHPERLNPLKPEDVICLPAEDAGGRMRSVCEDLHVNDFGHCGETVKLNQEIEKISTLHLHCEPIMEAAREARKRVHQTSRTVYAGLLVSEERHIQWLVLFRTLEYITNGQELFGSHEVFSLFHQRAVAMRLYESRKKKKVDKWARFRTNEGTTGYWMFYLLLVQDYRPLPLDCGDPPTIFSLKWLTYTNTSILAVTKYMMDESEASWSEALEFARQLDSIETQKEQNPEDGRWNRTDT